MSFESWEAEYYPISARDVVESGASDRELVAHALRKWRGLLPEILTAHEVSNSDFIDTMYHGASCALCLKHYARNPPDSCAGCPLERFLEGPCDEPSRGFENGLYHAALNDPQVMVEVLEAVLEELETADAD